MGEPPAAFATSLMLGILLLCFTQKLYATFWPRRNPVLLTYSPTECLERAYQGSPPVPALLRQPRRQFACRAGERSSAARAKDSRIRHHRFQRFAHLPELDDPGGSIRALSAPQFDHSRRRLPPVLAFP